MNPETVDAIKNALAPVAEKIGSGSEYAWEITVKAQFAEGVAMLVTATAALVAGIVALTMIWKWANKAKKEDHWSDAPFVAGAATLFIVVLGVGFITTGFYEGLIHVIAPEFKALEFFVGLVK